jgi:hypothetical protein
MKSLQNPIQAHQRDVVRQVCFQRSGGRGLSIFCGKEEGEDDW